jgi:glycosyltransferase involved in cell wall biosynthesis
VRAVHVVVPDGIDDPRRPSGGNVYDRRVCQALGGAGWRVHVHPVGGSWPQAGPRARAALAVELAGIPDAAVALVDGLVASAAPEELARESRRLRLVVLVHLPLGVTTQAGAVRDGERTVLGAVAAVVTTSGWTRGWLLETYALHVDRVHVAEPGVDRSAIAPGTPDGARLLCVAALTPGKGHDVLLAALDVVRDLRWSCVCVGSLASDPVHAARLLRMARDSGLAARVDLPGPRTGAALDATYAAADLLVLPSRFETYGMVVTEALARGLPVLVTDTGGLAETVGGLTDGSRPGVLVPAEDATALADALGRWLTDPAWRESLRRTAGARRTALAGWDRTAERVSRVLSAVAA